MDKNPLISVIIPVYNAGKWLPNCIDSVLGQTYENLEIILVDDGSVDSSGIICDQYSKRDSRIRVIHQKNQGVSNARNVGLGAVSGTLVSFIDSDDTLEPDMYEFLVKTMQEHDADIVHCGFNRVETSEIIPVYGTGKTYIQDAEQAVKSLLLGNLFNGALWNKLYRVENLRNIRFREELKINEDILFCFQAFQQSCKSVFIDFPKYNYYVRESASACFTTPNEKKRRDGLWVSEYIYNRLVGTKNVHYAVERYMRGLCSEFRHRKKDRKSLRKQIWDIYKKTPSVGKTMKITALLIHYCPRLYILLYNTYDKVRKPVWRV